MKNYYNLFIFSLLALVSCNNGSTEKTENTNTTNREAMIEYYNNFESEYVAPRNVEVWLPAGYDTTGATSYQVLYMHDGQNLFNPETSYANQPWCVDTVAARLIKEGKIAPVIIVGVWNTPNRFCEYQPQKPFVALDVEVQNILTQYYNCTEPLADKYLKFLVTELKPFIDKTYPTKPDAGNTFIMGSSMGGLISWYALSEYPEVFGGAGCVSTHWPIGAKVDLPELGDSMVAYFASAFPKAGAHKVYFDYGTATLDSLYEPYQLKADSVMQQLGYEEGKDWITRKFEGAEHNEPSWRKRVHIPLEFLLNK